MSFYHTLRGSAVDEPGFVSGYPGHNGYMVYFISIFEKDEVTGLQLRFFDWFAGMCHLSSGPGQRNLIATIDGVYKTGAVIPLSVGSTVAIAGAERSPGIFYDLIADRIFDCLRYRKLRSGGAGCEKNHPREYPPAIRSDVCVCHGPKIINYNYSSCVKC